VTHQFLVIRFKT